MSHLPMETLKLRLACGGTCYPLNTETSHYGTKDKYRMIGHCIIEKTDKFGIAYQPVHYPDVTLAADPDEFNRLKLAKSEDEWFEAGERLHKLTEEVPLGTVARHRKSGGKYRIIGHCVLGSELAEGLLYASLEHPDVTFMRPLSEFTEPIEADGIAASRFALGSLQAKLLGGLPGHAPA